jgi:putative phosphoesterase
VLRERLAPAGGVRACLGLISDTHMPDRLAALPEELFEALAGVDLLLHAGDVGELRVLDRLSGIAPVVAVHGNDDTAEAQRELPYQQLVVIGGTRILLCHSHDPDRAREMATRVGDDLAPKLDRWAGLASGGAAAVLVFGHIHIPMAVRHRGVLVVNPGAIASGNHASRQRVRTVALLYLMDDGRVEPRHVDLAAPDRPFDPAIDWSAGFKANAARFGESILDPALERLWARRHELAAQPDGDLGWAAYLRVAHRCWSGELERVTPAALLAELPPAMRPRIGALLEG